MISTKLSTARLSEIEDIAAMARSEAATRLSDLGLTLDLQTELRYTATVLTLGPVEPYANLSRHNERLAGILDWRGGCYRILFEAYDPLVRQRFSIAHELGHFFLHADQSRRTRCRCSQQHVDREELPEQGVFDLEHEADAFAGAFLLPTEIFRADLKHFGHCVAFLAERYQVSQAALRRRTQTLERLGL